MSQEPEKSQEQTSKTTAKKATTKKATGKAEAIQEAKDAGLYMEEMENLPSGDAIRATMAMVSKTRDTAEVEAAKKAASKPTATRARKMVFAKDGSPFGSERDAGIYGDNQFGPGKYDIFSVPGGFAIYPVVTKKDDTFKTTLPAAQEGERYMRVRFHERDDKNKPPNVELSVNGDVLVCQRGVETIIPERFVKMNETAIHPVYEQLPDSPRKVIAQIQHFPMTIIGDATEEEFVTLKRIGTLAAQKKSA